MEVDFANKVIGKLIPHFHCKKEQWDKTHKNRIDWILTDKIHGKHFGLEFKDYDHKRGNDLGCHILQSMRYAAAEFNLDGEWQRIPIFICPPISYTFLMCPVQESKVTKRGVYGRDEEYFHDRHQKQHTHHTVNGMLGALGIGEVRTMYHRHQHIYFSFSNKIIWQDTPSWGTNMPKGVHLKNYDLMINKPIPYKFL